MALHKQTGTGAPASTPTEIGQHYIDITNDVHYISVHTTDSTGWQKQSEGGHTHTKSDVTDFAHGLGSASHSSDILANLNAKISDATLIDTGDSRLSDSRICDNTFDNVTTSRTNLDVYSTGEVDGKVVGLYDHKGAYNASTNTPDLDTSPSGIKKGDAYTTSVAGTFFTEALEVGDVLIADQDDPTALSHWTRVNKNISFGTTTGTACEGDDARLSDARTPTAHTHPLADVTDSGSLAAKNTVATADIDNDSVTYAKMQNVSATDRILGRDTAGAGDVEEITPAALRTMINIEDGATADQTASEIKTAYESNADTNEFSDAEQTKLSGIETSATADQTGAEIKTAYEAEADTNAFSDAKSTKLSGIETSATADQTASEIKTAYESNADTNEFSDAKQTKLAGIETAADVTDATNVNAAGAVMESDTTTASMTFVIDEDSMASDLNTKVPTQQSVKKYVDDKVVSSVDYKGGYNASTNTPDLDTSPSGVKKGDMYTVTVAGTFFATALEVGDVLIAEIDSAAVEADWTVVQKDMDAASIKTSYESNADTNEFSDAEQTKLSGIETSATADQTGAEIKTVYEAEADTNAFTDAKSTKLDGIATAATANDTDANLKARANHTGTQTLATISDSGTAAAKNVGTASGNIVENGGTLGNSQTIETDGTGKLVTAAKAAAYNKAFGSSAATVCEGNDSRLSDDRNDADAIHDNVASEISVLTEKTSPVSGDHILIEDSAASNAKKRIQIGNLPASGGLIVVVKPSNETVVSSTTLQDDDDLKFAVLSGETWSFSFDLTVSEIANNPNLKFRIGATGGLTGSIEYSWWSNAGGAEEGFISNFTTTAVGISLGTIKSGVHVSGAIKATANGTVQLQWAQDSSDADATTVHALSKLIAHKA